MVVIKAWGCGFGVGVLVSLVPFIGATSLILLFEKGGFRKASNHLYHGCRQKQNRKPAVD